MASLVTVADFETWLGTTLEDSAIVRAEVVLDAVSALIRSEAAQLWASDVPADVQSVALQVATRVWTNPTGLRSESVGSYSVQYADPQAAGLYLTAVEKAILGRYRAQARGLWSLRITREDTAADTEYVPVVGTTNLFPWYVAGEWPL